MATEPLHPKRGKTYFLIAALLAGIALGIGTYTFIYAEGDSYLTDNPNACNNCHIMSDHFESWIKSSHHAVAACNDCHTPEGFIQKYLTKASNGFWHSWGFTTGLFPDPLQIKEENSDIAREACRKCHGEIAESMGVALPEGQETTCLPCHRYVGHQ